MSNIADQAEPMIAEDSAPACSATPSTCSRPNVEVSPKEVEKAEEAKLKAKYQVSCGWPISGHSAFLQKKLAKGQKFFDSGDYQMAKQTVGVNKTTRMAPPAALSFGTGEAIPTPETVPVRKTSIIQPKFMPPSSTTS